MRGIDNKPADNTARNFTFHEQTPAYAATSTLVLEGVNKNFVKYAQLTGAMTINATVTELEQWDEVVIQLESDGSSRTVTLGTGFESSGTVVVAADQFATVIGYFDGTAIRIASREISA